MTWSSPSRRVWTGALGETAPVAGVDPSVLGNRIAAGRRPEAFGEHWLGRR